MPDSIVPGFTQEQTWALRQLIKDAVREANDHDERVTKLEKCVYGNGHEGLDKCVTKLGKDVDTLVWWNRATLAACVSAIVAAVATMLGG
jgi:hypothetical protein